MHAIEQLDMEYVRLLEITRVESWTDHYGKKLKLLSDYTDLEESTSVKDTREMNPAWVFLVTRLWVEVSRLQVGHPQRKLPHIPDPDSDKLSDGYTSDDDDDDDGSPENCTSPLESHTLNSDLAQGNLVLATHCKLTSTHL